MVTIQTKQKQKQKIKQSNKQTKGWLLGFVENDLQVCMKDWFRLIEISNAKVNNLFPNISKNSYPIFVGNKIIGVLNVFKQEGKNKKTKF